ncbi:MAG TPA: ABC transporter ATP-binding protein [Caulobacteraceae bacterium]|nr:ABC transporter ATP-binding protein [Caulobacteraceae bacterium]
MAAAVAQIAGHLHDDDTDCPVCRSHFPIGALRQLAQESAGAQSAELAQAEANETRLASALAENAGSVAQAEAAIASAAEARRTAEADGAALRQREARVRAGLAEGATGLLAGALEAEARADADFAEASAAAATDAADIAQATLRRETLPSDIADLERQLEALAVAAASREADHRTRQERIAAAGPAATKAEDLTAQLAALQARLGEAEAVQRESQAAADGAGAALETARSRFDSSTQSAAGLEAARAAAADTVAALEARWRDAGLDGVPAAGTLETALAAVSQRAADVERLEDERAELVSASSLADRDEELKILVSEMEAVGGKGAADDPEPRDAALATALAAAEDVHRQSRDAQTAVRALSEKLRDEAESFSTRFLEPLNHLIEGFNEALLSTPGDSVRFQADNRVDTTHFEMGLQYRDPLEDALFNKELPPQVVLSEGQLAANGFSILCAASTAYPWSRWRSLLLDDPLQHNDIIHAAAFVDLMRNLVEMERYQLLMSSHDRGEAEFIARKFEAAGLPCKVIALTAPSRAGVRYEEPQPNSAAQTLLQESRAMSA